MLKKICSIFIFYIMLKFEKVNLIIVYLLGKLYLMKYFLRNLCCLNDKFDIYYKNIDDLVIWFILLYIYLYVYVFLKISYDVKYIMKCLNMVFVVLLMICI